MGSVIKALCLNGESLTFSEVSLPLDSKLFKGKSFTVPIDKEGISNAYVEAFGEFADLPAIEFFVPDEGMPKASFVQTYDFGNNDKDYICCRGDIYFVCFSDDQSFEDIKEDQVEYFKSVFKVEEMAGEKALHYYVDAS